MRNLETALVTPSGYGNRRHSRGSTRHRSVGGPTVADSVVEEHAQAEAAEARAQATAQRRQEYESKRKRTLEEQQQRKARKTAQQKLVQLVMAEDDTVMMLQELAEKLERQRDLLEYCQRHTPHRLLHEQNVERQLEQEHRLLATQLTELRAVRTKLEEGLGAVKDPVMTTMRGPSANKKKMRQFAPEEDPPRQLKRATTFTINQATGVPAAERAYSFTEMHPVPVVASAVRSRSQVVVLAATSPKDQELADAQRDLERREQVTRLKLQALKQQFMQQQRGSTQGTGLPPGLPRMAFSEPAQPQPQQQQHSVKSRVKPTSRAVQPADEPSRRRTERAASSSSSTSSSDEAAHDMPLVHRRAGKPPLPLNSKSRPTAPGQQERQYLQAVEQQKGRITQIRRMIRAATTIQRAWRACRFRRRLRGPRG